MMKVIDTSLSEIGDIHIASDHPVEEDGEELFYSQRVVTYI